MFLRGFAVFGVFGVLVSKPSFLVYPWANHTQIPCFSENHRKSSKRVKKTSKKGSKKHQKGSKTSKKWSNRAVVVDFDQELLTRLTKNCSISGISEKPEKTTTTVGNIRKPPLQWVTAETTTTVGTVSQTPVTVGQSAKHPLQWVIPENAPLQWVIPENAPLQWEIPEKHGKWSPKHPKTRQMVAKTPENTEKTVKISYFLVKIREKQ